MAIQTVQGFKIEVVENLSAVVHREQFDSFGGGRRSSQRASTHIALALHAVCASPALASPPPPHPLSPIFLPAHIVIIFGRFWYPGLAHPSRRRVIEHDGHRHLVRDDRW